MSKQGNTPLVNHAASWISLGDWRQCALPAYAPFAAFRRDILVPRRCGKVECFITASARYTLWVDGDLVASGPARSWPGRWLVDRIDLSDKLRAGRHQLAVLVHPPTGGKAYGLCMPLALCAWVTAGKRMLLHTDQDWHARAADWIRHYSMLSALPVGWQEHHASGSGWTTARPGPGWAPAGVYGSLGDTPPWGRAEVHPLPVSAEDGLPARLAWSGRVSYKGQPDGNLVTPFLAARHGIREGQQQGPAFWLDCVGRNTITLDTGRTRTLRPGCRILKSEGDVRLDCFLDIEAKAGRPMAGTGFGTGFEGFADSLNASSPQLWWRTQPRGARFITWCANGRGRVLVEPLCRSVEYPYPDHARFSCEDPFFQRIWDLAGETIRASTTDVLVDTCFRENSLWTFDACATGLGAYYRFGETAMPGHSFRLVADGVQENGTIAGIVPSEGEGVACMLPDQTFSWVHTCRRFHDLTGDDTWADAVLPAMRRVVGLLERYSHRGFFVPPGWMWHWVDWAAIDKRPYSAVINLLALRAVRSTRELARSLGRMDMVDSLATLEDSLTACCLKFQDPRSGAWRQHIVPTAGRGGVPGLTPHNAPHDPSQPVCLHANALALGLGLGAGRGNDHGAACCAGLLSQPVNSANTCGPGWIADLLTPCCGVMDTAIVRRYLEQTYGRCFLETGAPTFGERFTPDRFNTAHGWGASVVTLMVEGLLGLRPDSPGWRTVRFRPRWPGSGDVKYSLVTTAGRIQVSRRNGKWRIVVPRGCRVI